MGGKDAAHPAVFVYLRAQGSRAFSYHAPPSPPALLAHVRDSARYDGGGEDLVVEVLDDLVGTRPLLWRDDEIDVTTTEAIQRPVGDAKGIKTQLTEAIAPRHGGCPLLERAHRGSPMETAGSFALAGLRKRGKGTSKAYALGANGLV